MPPSTESGSRLVQGRGLTGGAWRTAVESSSTLWAPELMQHFPVATRSWPLGPAVLGLLSAACGATSDYVIQAEDGGGADGGADGSPAAVVLPAEPATSSLHVFDGQDDNAAVPTEWDFNNYKGDCGASAAIAGLSTTADAGVPHALLCWNGGAEFSGQEVAVLSDVATADHRRAARSAYVQGQTDWDVNHYKSECGLNEYVSGVSQTTAGRMHGLRCASASMSNGGQDGCETHAVATNDGYTWDWDVGYMKGQCGAYKVVVGVSADTATGEPHAILCCSE
jgi:hypothetical protein